MAGGGGENEMPLEYTPTWVVASVCTVIVVISLALERLLHFLGKYLKKKNQKPLFEALQKVKEELMLLGFISLLLTVFQGSISRMCIPEGLSRHMLPCKKGSDGNANAEAHFQSFFFSGVAGSGRRLLSGGTTERCPKGKVHLLSVEALHQLHIFIFVLALVHVVFCLLIMILGGARIHQWKHWEGSIAAEKYDTNKVLSSRFTHVRQHTFIREHFLGVGNNPAILSWLHSFVKQFYGSVTKSDYITLRLGFINTHCKANPKFNFHRYMLLLAVGTKLEFVISQLAHEVAEKHTAIEGELMVHPSDDLFWFNRPQIVLYLIHFILFQNAFEIAFFFWILTTYGFDSCIMGQVRYIVPRLVIGVIIQILCSYSTLPLYAIVTQMGSYFKNAIFDEHMQEGIVGWAQNAKQRKGQRAAAAKGRDGSSQETKSVGSSSGIELPKMAQDSSKEDEAPHPLIQMHQMGP